MTDADGEVDCGAHWLVEVGHPADRLVAAAADANASMIVVGSHGPRSSLLGSVSAEISRRAPCPVVVVPPGTEDRLNDKRDLPRRRHATSSSVSQSATRAASSASGSAPDGRRSAAAASRGRRHELRRLDALGMGGRDSGPVNEWDEVPRAEPAGNDTLAQPLPASDAEGAMDRNAVAVASPEDRQSDVPRALPRLPRRVAADV